METEKVIRIPTVSSWRIVLLLVFLLVVATELTIFGLTSQSLIFFISGAVTVIIISIIMMFIPKYAHSQSSPSSVTCALAILLQLLLLFSTLKNSWPAILFWIMAGKSSKLYYSTLKWHQRHQVTSIVNPISFSFFKRIDLVTKENIKIDSL